MQAIDLSHSRLLILRVSAAERESLLATSGRSEISMKFVQMRTLVLATVTCACGTAIASSQTSMTSSPTGVISGTVTDSSLTPIAGAEISILLSQVRAIADERGRFQIIRIPTGSYILRVRRIGYESIAASVQVEGGDTLRLALTLEPMTVSLPATKVTASTGSPTLREFEERRRRGVGEFFGYDEIQARNAVSVVDMLRQAKGVRLELAGGKTFVMSARQWTLCPMQIYIDGVPVAGSNPRVPFDAGLLPSPKELMGIEVYSGPEQEPLWLPRERSGMQLSCGAVLVWSRDGSER